MLEEKIVEYAEHPPRSILCALRVLRELLSVTVLQTAHDNKAGTNHPVILHEEKKARLPAYESSQLDRQKILEWLDYLLLSETKRHLSDICSQFVDGKRTADNVTVANAAEITSPVGSSG
jgi:hypothetical protein